MARLDSISIPDSDVAFWKEFAEVAKKEGGKSHVLVTLAHEWYRKHGKGNPSFKLEQFEQEGFFALPTIGEPLKDGKKMSEADLKEIAKHAKARMEEAEFELKRRKDLEWGNRR